MCHTSNKGNPRHFFFHYSSNTPLFSRITVAPSAPRATIWFLNSRKPRTRVKANYFSTKKYFQSRFYCRSKLSNQLHSQGLVSLFLSYRRKVPCSGRFIKSKCKAWRRGCYPTLSSSNRKKPEKNSRVD